MEYLIIEKANGDKINLFGCKSPIKITKGEQRKKMLGENILSLTLESVNPINFSIRDKITAFSEDYFLNLLPTVRKTGNRRFSYDAVFESIQYDIAKIVFLDEDLSGKSTDSRFPLRANLKEILGIIINNLNRDNPGLFRLGSYPDTDIRDFQYSDNNCLAILQQTCEAYETEFEIKKNGSNYILNIGTIGRNLPLTFRYGLGGGAYEISRQTVDSSNIITRLFAYGSDKNIPSNYRNFASRLRLAVNAKSYIEDTDAIKAFGIIEGIKSFEDVFPHREGIVTSINADILSFTDSSMDFDLNEKDANETKYLIDGTSAKITFNTGGLAGYTFEILKNGGYNHATKTFKLIQYKDERGFIYPSPDTTTYQIKVGDKYVITDIYPPQSYITAAENKLLEKAKEHLKGNSAPRVQYEIKILESFLKKYAGSQTANIFEIGDYVGIIDKDINVDRSENNAIRINGFTRDLIGHTPYAYTLEVSDAVEVDVIERIISEQNKVDTIIKINDLADVYKNKRSYKTTQELLNMVFDQEGYFNDGNIRPNSIETQMLSVGAKAQQMILQNTVIEANYQGNGNVVRVDGGTLVHYGLFDTPKTWNITTQTTTITTGDGGLYIYARCPKGEGEAVILFEQEQKKVEDSNSYYFIVGVLHSLEGGVRWVSLTYGSSSINGAFIKTGKIVSSDGQNYIDLDNNQMRLGDSKSAIEWNKKGDKKLRIQGSVVVSPSGDESPAEVDRGNYNSSKAYFVGDKVWYNGIAYSCYKDAPIGTNPAYSTYWKPYADNIDNGSNMVYQGDVMDNIVVDHKTGKENAVSDGAATGYIDLRSVSIQSLIVDSWQQGNYNNGTGEYQPDIKNYICQKDMTFVDSGKEYLISWSNNFKFWILTYNSAKQFIETIEPSKGLFIPKNGISYIRFNGRKTDFADFTVINQETINATETYLHELNKDIYITISNKINEQFRNPRTVFYGVDKSYLSGSAIGGLAYRKETFKIPKTARYLRFSANAIVSSGNKVNRYDWKVEYGTEATTWNLNYQDTIDKIEKVQSEAQALEYLKKALEGSTTIDGGLLLTSMIQLGIINGNNFVEKAGINGTAKNNNDVVAWFGGTLQQAIQNLASIVFKLDGSGQLAKGNINWDANGNVNMKGSFLGSIETKNGGDRIIIDANSNTIRLVNTVQVGINTVDVDIIKLSWSRNDWGFMQPSIEMREVNGVSNGQINYAATMFLSPSYFRWYRYGDTNNPFITIDGGWSTKQIKLSRFVIPENRPSTADTLYRSGENLKITPSND